MLDATLIGLGGKRDLNGLGLTATSTNWGGSIATCLAYCKARGFVYAGVEYGYENLIKIDKCYVGLFSFLFKEMIATVEWVMGVRGKRVQMDYLVIWLVLIM